jgi:hypothetical protein
MKLKDGFVTHEMGSQQILVGTGSTNFAGMVRSNPTAGFIVECLKESVTREQIIDKMLEKYDVTREVVAADVDKIIAKLRSINALDE